MEHPFYVERRDRPATGNIELRAGDAAGGAPMLSGYAARFNSPAVIGGYFIEKLAPGCFANSIARGDQRMLYNHDANYLLGRTTSGTLTLSEDALGLKFELDPPDTCCGRDVVESVRRADLNGCSFAFQSVQETWDDTGDMPVRTIEVLDLLETSIVVWPAYKDTSVGVRSGKTGPFREIAPASIIAARQRMKQGLLRRETPHVFH